MQSQSKIREGRKAIAGLMAETHRCIGQLVSFPKLSNFMRDRLFEALGDFKYSTNYVAQTKSSICCFKLEKSLTQPKTPDALPDEWVLIEDWFAENKDRIPVDIHGMLRMSIKNGSAW